MFRSIDISTSGLVAQRQRMNTIAGNIANQQTTRDADGNRSPFQRRLVTFTTQAAPDGKEGGGVGVNYQVEVDTAAAPRLVFQPGHPDANEDGYVAFPDINLTTEFVNALDASRAYEANVAAIDVTKGLINNTLKILA